jgi:hypothetical protein
MKGWSVRSTTVFLFAVSSNLWLLYLRCDHYKIPILIIYPVSSNIKQSVRR